MPNRKHQKQDGAHKPAAVPEITSSGKASVGSPKRSPRGKELRNGALEPKFDLDREVERIILNRYGPPGFIVDDRLHILKFRGRTRPYLDPSPGKPSLNLLKMIRPELASEVRAAIQHARRESTAVRRDRLSVRLNGRSKEVDLHVHPVGGSAGEHWYLVLLEEVKTPSRTLLAKLHRGAVKSLKGGTGVDRRAVLHLKRDLSASRRQLRIITKEAEAASEKLQSAKEVEQQRTELARSNQDLEQFAHAASHDLREPLRMVISFLQMISERYAGKLDEEGDEWIRYAVEGAERMQHLIGDLLAYAQVGKGHTPTTLTSVDEVLNEVQANLEAPIRESSAVIERGPLPSVAADRTEMVQLFQNLIVNAIKFRGDKAPVIRINARNDGRWWNFTVGDNGIGIPPEHRERIFAMFQRLHDRAQYPGTGVGLAICRKIVDRLGGKIWVESADGAGSAFKFTIPISAEQIRKSGGDSEPVAG